MKKFRTNLKVKIIFIAVTFLLILSSFSLFIPNRENFTQNSKDPKYNYLESSSSGTDFEYSWNVSLGGLYNDICAEVRTDSQNDVYMVGYTDIDGLGNHDLFISKHDTNGQEEWVKTWGGGNDDQGSSIYIDSSDDIYVIGYTRSLGDTDGDLLIIKFDTMGNEIWNITWGSTDYEIGYGITEDSFGNFYITGMTKSFGDVDGDVFLIKFDNLFEEQWNITWGGSELDVAYQVEVDSNSYIYITGHSESLDPDPAQSDVFLLKYNSSGDLEWERDWAAPYTQRGRGLAIDSNDNIYITGYTFGHPASSGKGYILKYNSAGTYQWLKLWGFDGEVGNYFYNIIIDNQDDLYISGATKYYGIYGNYDSILLNYDTSGNLNWYKLWITSGSDSTSGIYKDSIGNIYLAGGTDFDTAGEYDIVLIKYMNTLALEINIITPENITYNEPMSGYYPGTYGFENDNIGELPHEWAFEIGVPCSIQVIDELDAHKNVVELYDGTTSNSARMINNFTDQIAGTVEMWFRRTDPAEATSIRIKDPFGTFPIDITSLGGMFRWNNQSVWNDIAPCNSDQWYHLRIDFNCTSQKFDVYIDEIRYLTDIPFQIGSTSLVQLTLETRWVGSTGYYTYYDAIGYSWDSNYDIGDNLNEGLLLSYESTTTLEWQGYSLDGNANKTILGNTTIPMPSDGLHYIQVFGNDTMGSMYASDIQYFSVDNSFITIVTPENIEYFEPMRGYYLGTNGFEDTKNGLLPSNMDDFTSDSNCQAIVVSEKTNHNKVVHIDDDSTSGIVRLDYNFTNFNYGFLEFWILAEDATNELVMQLWDDNTNTYLFRFNIIYNHWHYYIDSYWTKIPAFDGFCNPEDNTWYHITVHFRGDGAPAYQELDENQYKLIINDRDSGRINFNNIGASINRLMFYTSDTQTSDFWIDAIGGSYDLNYNLGDNLNEGMLLSFNHSDNFDWIGYSLDGNPNITITGNKVIPIPEIGVHSIILNGITSEGMTIQSDLRYFITYYQNSPPLQPDNPYLIPILLTSLGIGIVVVLSITLLLLRRKIYPRTSYSTTYQPKAQTNENIDSGRDQPNFCPFCGSRIEIPSRFCANCGTSIENL